MIITLDGPSASGKSSIARILATDLRYVYLNTGLLYRALGYILMQRYGYTLDTLKAPKEKDIQEALIKDCFEYTYDVRTGSQIFFKKEDITSYLKTPCIDQASSIVSADEYVRFALLGVQRALGELSNLVAEGRDCGSVVFPEADYKFFITASLLVRAHRWQEDQKKKGIAILLKGALESITVRDERDSHREVAPLVIPQGAYVLDTSSISISQSIECIKKIISDRTRKAK